MIELLWEEAGLPEQRLPDALRARYGGGLGFDLPVLFANFVETLDGIVAIPGLDASNALVADGSEADRFVMGLLRASADAVLIGSGTLLSSPKGTWRPERVYPAAAEAFAQLRAAHGLADRPAVAVVSSGATLDVSHPVLQDAVVLTTERGAAQLRGVLPDVVAVNDGDWVDLHGALGVLRARGHARVLSEAGPTMFGSLLADGLVDELFLTLSPVLAGRGGAGSRLGLVEGVELLPQAHVGGRVVSVRRSDSHLFLRYRF
ncbi:MAG TPA: dihydrofolate reductase family protein [Gaiellaceae bacterium]|nr:dihydrofolate reductase family protein [Gaiellaceae bacterium]